MANTKSAEKAARQSTAHRARNDALTSQLRSAIRKATLALKAGNQTDAAAALAAATPIIDSMVNKGIIHRNKAARHKSRLTKQVRALAEVVRRSPRTSPCAAAGRAGAPRGSCITACLSSAVPAPVAPEISNTGPFQRSRRTISAARRFASLGSSRSILLMTSQRSLAARSAANFLSSATMVRASLHRIGVRIGRRDIDQMQQHAGALQMLQEPDAEPRAFRRALDQARNVRHDEAAAGPHAHHAEIGCKRRERIIGDFRPRGRNRTDQGGFAGVRKPEQAHVGDQLQLERELALLARQARARTCAGCDWCST